jgi:hypothetical protein
MPETKSERETRHSNINSALRGLDVNSEQNQTGQVVSNQQVQQAATEPDSLRSNADLKWPNEMPNQGGKK